jgi:hypothetical protein
VHLLDRHGVLSLRQPHYASYAADGSSVKVVVELADSRQITLDLSNCPEPHVCGFLRDAAAMGLLDHVPETCMCDGSSCAPCVKVPKSAPLPEECTSLVDPATCDAFLACQPVRAADGGMTTRAGCP